MIIRGKPKNLEKYIIVDGDSSSILHRNNFYPKYIDNEFIYYLKNDEILSFMERSDLKWK